MKIERRKKILIINTLLKQIKSRVILAQRTLGLRRPYKVYKTIPNIIIIINIKQTKYNLVHCVMSEFYYFK